MTSTDASIVERVLSTTPLDKYNHLVDNILYDKKSGWNADHYKNDGRSSLDPEIGRMTAEKRNCDAAITDNEKLMVECDKNIQRARLPKTDKNYKKASPGEISRWDKQYVQAQEDIMHDANRSDELREKIELWSWNRYIDVGRTNRLKWLRDKYMRDDDLEFLRKGVTWVCAYADCQSYNLTAAEAVEVSEVSLSAW